MAKKLYEESNIQAIADAIRTKNGTTNTYTTAEMAAAITAIESGSSGECNGIHLPEEALTITGSCQDRFVQNHWNWFIETYGDKITTNNITHARNMFNYSSELKDIPFEINMNSESETDMGYMFYTCKNLLNIPKINGAKPSTTEKMFSECVRLRYLPEDIGDWFDWSYIEARTGAYEGKMSNMFYNCRSLRKVPISLLKHSNPNGNYSSGYLSGAFNACFALDELTNLPFPCKNAKWTASAFSSTFSSCYRLKNITFELQEDGSPFVMNWAYQTIDLSKNIGWVGSAAGDLITLNSGITADKEVTDDATYQALKDDPDWFTKNEIYSRYNHDSAVATINTLPDTSAISNGTNVIKFKGTAGSATDGGAINTLTEEEIAVATAKGWTVQFV